MRTIAVIGAGKIGTEIARAALAAGYEVILSNSKGPRTLDAVIAGLGPKASAATVEDAVARGDSIVVAIPFGRFRELPATQMAGKIVIDANNYVAERDGVFEELELGQSTTAEMLQAHLADSKVVKAFGHIRASELVPDARPAGSSDRRALAIAGDDAGAKEVVAGLVDAFGFDVLDLGPLAEGWRVQRGTPAFVAHLNLDELRSTVENTKPDDTQTVMPSQPPAHGRIGAHPPL